jgi:hypothetical protein
MDSQEKIKEIKKQLSKGVPEGEIRADLKEQGYSNEEIEKFFVPHKYDMRSWYLTFAILLFLFGVWYFLNNGGLVFIGLSGLLFFAYYKETERLKKQ